MNETLRPGDHFFGIRCPHCETPIAIGKGAPSVKLAADPDAQVKVTCQNSKCTRFGSEETYPASAVQLFKADSRQ